MVLRKSFKALVSNLAIRKKAFQMILRCIRKIKFYRTVQQAIKLKKAGRIVLRAFLRWKFRK